MESRDRATQARLLAVKMAVKLQKAVTLPEIAAHPVLADLAALIDARSADQPDGR